MSVSVTRASAHSGSAPADPLQGVSLLECGRQLRYGQCGTTIPVQPGSELPVGLQIIGRPGDDAALLALIHTVAAIAGSPPTSIS